MIDYEKLLPFLIEAASFISAFAAIAAGIIMTRFLKKFVTGILATGFKTIGIGIFIVALAIIIDAFELYIQTFNRPELSILLIIRQALLVLGAYIIVIGSKTMGEKLETLSKHKAA